MVERNLRERHCLAHRGVNVRERGEKRPEEILRVERVVEPLGRERLKGRHRCRPSRESVGRKFFKNFEEPLVDRLLRRGFPRRIRQRPFQLLLQPFEHVFFPLPLIVHS